MSANELLISDAEYLFAEKALLAYLGTMAEAGQEFQEIIDLVLNYALDDPAISEKLANLSGTIGQITEKISLMAESLEGESQQFIEQIDEKDEFIY